MDVDAKVSGIKELEKKFDLLDKKIGLKVMVKATRAGANEIKKEIKANVPVKTGELKKSITSKKQNIRGKKGLIVFKIGTKPTGDKELAQKNAIKLNVLEYGRKKGGAIPPKPVLKRSHKAALTRAIGKYKTVTKREVEKAFNEIRNKK